mmetsp:Transcript_3590/g.9118  ORF Transcript_3590/g.9118 Transcript_3590/m.9118 type:complete len:147 (+) Transcript_3590:1176-1616(+)
MSVAQASRKDLSWDTMTTMRSFFAEAAPHSQRRCLCSHRTPCRSRWFVGSSSSKSMGSTKRAWARATRMRQPPDMSLVCLCIIFSVKPRPCRSSQARGSNVSGSILSSLSWITPSMSACFSTSSSMSLRLSASRRACSEATTSTTA